MEGVPVFLKSSLAQPLWQAGAAPLSQLCPSTALQGTEQGGGHPQEGCPAQPGPRPGLSVPRVSRAGCAVVAQRWPRCVPDVSCAQGLCWPCALQGECCWWPRGPHQGLGWLWALWPCWGTQQHLPCLPPCPGHSSQVLCAFPHKTSTLSVHSSSWEITSEGPGSSWLKDSPTSPAPACGSGCGQGRVLSTFGVTAPLPLSLCCGGAPTCTMSCCLSTEGDVSSILSLSKPLLFLELGLSC